jgi:septal ring factor EnvC (AmiA/AmiB activator)
LAWIGLESRTARFTLAVQRPALTVGNRPVLRLAVAAVLTGLLPSGGAWPQSLPDAQRRLDQTRQQLDSAKRAEREIAEDVSALKAEREQLNRSLLETARLIQKSEAQLSSIEARQGELEAQERLLRGSLAQRHDSIAKLLAAMQRMGRNPPPAMITRREDALQMVRSAMMLATVFPELREQALELGGRLTELARVMADIKSEGDKLKAETARLNESQIRLAQLTEARRLSLAERQAELDKVRREAMEIAQSVSDLNELIARLDRTVAEHAARQSPPAASPKHEPSREIALAPVPPAAPSLPPPPPAARPAVTPPPPAAKDAERPAAAAPGVAVEIAPKGNQVAALNPGASPMKPAVPFAQAKAQLQLPAHGRRVLSFGDKTHNDGRSKGIVLETRHSAQVVSPADGWVVYAGEFRSFGQLLILNAGEGYHILLAGLSQIDVQLGEFVLAGLPLGLMAAQLKGTKAKGADTAPVLYIEFRKDGSPINPDPWWLPESSKKVQG